MTPWSMPPRNDEDPLIAHGKDGSATSGWACPGARRRLPMRNLSAPTLAAPRDCICGVKGLAFPSARPGNSRPAPRIRLTLRGGADCFPASPASETPPSPPPSHPVARFRNPQNPGPSAPHRDLRRKQPESQNHMRFIGKILGILTRRIHCRKFIEILQGAHDKKSSEWSISLNCVCEPLGTGEILLNQPFICEDQGKQLLHKMWTVNALKRRV